MAKRKTKTSETDLTFLTPAPSGSAETPPVHGLSPEPNREVAEGVGPALAPKHELKRAGELEAAGAPKATRAYTVLARRYRPQKFAEIIGQEPVARALVNALESHRVAHAYLFTGARGVGKTSTARILAKSLNCVRGPTVTPCDACDMCRSIASGEDVDVLEIDGASNRGIDEIREIRQNVQYRPQRGRYKIYIIDEVHMLTPPAFNALLKTLEEPPPHVKFIFATTDVQKIPLTILSRCQRFDFAGISADRIVEHLRQVVSQEGVHVDNESLEFLARRAAGSMRDAQSLLDQVLAFVGGNTQSLEIEQIHGLLGTAADDRIVALAGAILDRDVKAILAWLEQTDSLQLGEIIDQLIAYWRDLMVLNCAGAKAKIQSLSSRHRPTLAQQAENLSLDTILAGLDMLTATKARMRGSNHGNTLLEMALIRMSRLDDLISIASLGELMSRSGMTIPKTAVPARGSSLTGDISAPRDERAVAEKKNPPSDFRSDRSAPQPVTEATIHGIWQTILQRVGPILGNNLRKAEAPIIAAPTTLVLRFAAVYNEQCTYCQEPERLARAEDVLRKITGQEWKLRVELIGNVAAALAVAAADADKSPSRYRRQRTEALQEPLVRRAAEVLGAQIVQLDEGFGSAPREALDRPESAESEEG